MIALEELVARAHALVRDPYPALAERAAREGGGWWGYTCLFAPEELLDAAGLGAVRLFGAAASLHRADRCMTSNCCEFARNLLESFLDGRFRFLAGTLAPHGCDPLQVAMDVARRETGTPFLFVHVPTRIDPPRARPFLVAELERVRAALEAAIGRPIHDEDLARACDRAARRDRLLEELYALRRERPGIVAGADATALVFAGLFLPVEEHCEWLEIALRGLRERPYVPPRRFRRRIVLSGFLNGGVALVDLVERSGAIVVDDDLCEGSRRVTRAVAAAGASPLERVADRVLGRSCPVKLGGAELADVLRERYRAAGADGAILAHFPFCDPQLLEYAGAVRHFAAEGLNVLLVEVVIGDRNFGQLQTRVEAFLERLRPRRSA